MVTRNALIQKIRARWQHYLLLGRWRRADRVKRLLDRLTGGDPVTYRQSA